MMFPTDGMVKRRIEVEDRIKKGEKIRKCRFCNGMGYVKDTSGFDDWIWETCRCCWGRGYLKSNGEPDYGQ